LVESKKGGKMRWSWLGLGIFLVLGQADATGVGLTPIIGLNQQTLEVRELSSEGSGLSAHFGVEGVYYLTPGFLPLQLGIGSGILFQNARYHWETGIEGLKTTLSLDNLVIPFEVKLKLALLKGWEALVGTGFSVIHNLSGEWRLEGEGGVIERDLDADELETDLGFNIDLGMGYQFAPMLRVVPGMSYQLNLTADDSRSSKTEHGSTWFLSIGLGITL
jgi:hypothetical protein